jgi:hypothetical protein
MNAFHELEAKILLLLFMNEFVLLVFWGKASTFFWIHVSWVMAIAKSKLFHLAINQYFVCCEIDGIVDDLYVLENVQGDSTCNLGLG